MTIFRILGPVEVAVDDRRLSIGGRRQLKLLAVLLLSANRAVSTDQLIDTVWGPRRSGAANRLQMTIARLRKVLDPLNGTAGSRLKTVGGGYMLSLGPGELDADLFEAKLQQAREFSAAGDAEGALEMLASALELWRGPVLAEVAFEDFAQPAIRHLEELRIEALEARIEAQLELGRHDQVVGELERLLGENPTRERLAEQLMLALYRCGRQGDALEVYQRTRDRLAEELGIDPGPPLKEMQQRILEHARSLDPGRGPTGLGVPAASRAAPPSPPTRTIGRDAEIDEVCDLLSQPEVRLITLTGTGGVGKTRIALEVAHALAPSFPDGVCWVELAAVASPDEVTGTIAQALALGPQPGETTSDTLCRYLRSRRMLLVIDNFEHLLDAAVLVAELLGASNGLRVLVTSREVLDLAAEHRFAVQPLSVPTSVDELQASPACELFVLAARRRDKHFELNPTAARAVVQICQVLEGLPLALELAAARTGMLGVNELAARLEETAVDLAGGPRDAPARQKTLRQTIDWSFRLLGAGEALAFVRFAVFAGGATVDAAEAITRAAAGTIQALVEKNLIERRIQSDGSPRLGMLETIRAYADERLAREPDYQDVRGRHSDYYLRFLEQTARLLWTAREPEGMAAIDSEIDNVHAALRWALDQAPAQALRIAGALADYWQLRGNSDGLAWVEAALHAAVDGAPTRARARAEVGRAWQLMAHQRVADAAHAATTARELYRELGDDAGMSEAYMALTHITERRGNRAEARAFAEDACRHARLSGEDRVLEQSMARLADKLPADERPAAVAEARRLFERTGNHRAVAHLHSNLGYKAILEGHPEEALRFLDVAVDAVTKSPTPHTTMFVAGNVALANLFIGDYAQARQAFVRQLEVCRGHAFVYGADEGLVGLAAVAATENRFETAARLLGAADALGYFSSAPDTPVFERLERDFFGPGRECYGAAAWQRAEEIGAAMPYDDAIAYALEDSAVPSIARSSDRLDPSTPSTDASLVSVSALTTSAANTSGT